MKLCSFQEFQLHHTDVSNCVPALRLWQQAFFVLRLRVLPRQLGALQTPRSAYRRQRANLLHTKTAGSFDLKQARASDTNLPHWCWRAGEWGEIVYNQQWAVSKYGAVISCINQSGWHRVSPWASWVFLSSQVVSDFRVWLLLLRESCPSSSSRMPAKLIFLS